MMGALPLLVLLIFESNFTLVKTKFYMEFVIESQRSLKAGSENTESKIRLYDCSGVEKGREAHAAANIRCSRVKPWRKNWVYGRANFYIVNSPLQNTLNQQRILFSDMVSDHVPSTVMIGFTSTAIDCPNIRQTPAMLRYFEEKSKGWLLRVETSKQQDLLQFLALADIKEAAAHSDVWMTYSAAYLYVLGQVVVTYDAYFKGKVIGNGQSKTPASTPSQHEAQDVENELKAAIPLLSNKMIDPCVLQFDTGTKKDDACKVYCNFLRVTAMLFKKSTSGWCGNLLADRGACVGKYCKCVQEFHVLKLKKVKHKVSMVYCNNMFRTKLKEPKKLGLVKVIK